MNIRQFLAVTAIPFVIGTFGFVAPQANAEAPSNRIAQLQQHPRPQDRPQRADDNHKRQKHRLHQKKRPPQPNTARRIPSPPPADR